MALELMRGGELFEYVAMDNGTPLPETICRTYFRQLLMAIHHMHASGVVHRDIKLENILLDETFTLKLADFGMSASTVGTWAKEGHFKTQLGTGIYMAPEIWGYNTHSYGPEVDLWAATVSLFLLRIGSVPFPVAHPFEKKKAGNLYTLISGNATNKLGNN